MAALSSGDLAILRYPYRRVVNMYAFTPYLQVEGTALVNQGSFTYPLAQLTVDNTSANWTRGRIGCLFRIQSPAGVVKHEGALRLRNEAATMYFNYITDGDSGLAQEQAASIANNDEIIVYRQLIPYATLSRVDTITGEVLKRGTIGYSDQTLNPSPQVNLGPPQYSDVDSGTSLATFNLSASGAFSWTGTTLTYQWILPDEATITVGTDTDSDITITLPEGQYRIGIGVTDNADSSRDRFQVVYLYARGPNYKAFSEVHNIVAIENDQTTRKGWSCSLTIAGNPDELPTPDDYLYPGAQLFLTYVWQFSQDGKTWVELSGDQGVMKFVGYLRSYTNVYNDRDQVAGMTLDYVNYLEYLRSLPAASQGLFEATTPASWQEVSTSLNHIPYMMWYMIDNHARAAAAMTDFNFYDDLDDFKSQAFAIKAGSLTAGMENIMALVLGANMGVTNDGEIQLRRNMVYESSSFRSGKANRMTITDADIIGQISYDRDRVMQYQMAEGGAFVYGAGGTTASYRVRAGLYAPMLGVSTEVKNGFIALSLSDAKDRIGHHAAYLNRPTASIPVQMRADVIDPVHMEPSLMAASSYDPLSTPVYSGRVMPLKVTRSWSSLRNFAPPDVFVDFEPETEGKPGLQVPEVEPGRKWGAAAACPTLSVTWASIGATPAGWTGLTGTDEDNPQTYFGAPYTTWAGARSSMANWQSACIPEALGVLYEFVSPCVLSHISATFTWTATPNTKRISFLGFVNGAWTTIDTVLYGAGVNNTGATYSWTGSAIVSKVIFGCATSSTSSVIAMTVSKINSP